MWIDVLSKYLAHVVEEHPLVRVFGVGFGHQIIARAFGGAVVHDKAHAEVGGVMWLTPAGRVPVQPHR